MSNPQRVALIKDALTSTSSPECGCDCAYCDDLTSDQGDPKLSGASAFNDYLLDAMYSSVDCLLGIVDSGETSEALAACDLLHKMQSRSIGW